MPSEKKIKKKEETEDPLEEDSEEEEAEAEEWEEDSEAEEEVEDHQWEEEEECQEVEDHQCKEADPEEDSEELPQEEEEETKHHSLDGLSNLIRDYFLYLNKKKNYSFNPLSSNKRTALILNWDWAHSNFFQILKQR